MKAVTAICIMCLAAGSTGCANLTPGQTLGVLLGGLAAGASGYASGRARAAESFQYYQPAYRPTSVWTTCTPIGNNVNCVSR